MLVVVRYLLYPPSLPDFAPDSVALCYSWVSAYTTIGTQYYQDAVDWRSFPTVLPPIAHPTFYNHVHVDFFAGNTGPKAMTVMLLNAAGNTSIPYFVDTYHIDSYTPHPLLYDASTLYSYNFQYGVNGGVWAQALEMYWYIQYFHDYCETCGYIATSPLIPVVIQPLTDTVNCSFLPMPDPTASSFTVFVLYTTTGLRTFHVTLLSSDSLVVHATGTGHWTGVSNGVVEQPATSARVIGVYMSLSEGVHPGQANLLWLVESFDSASLSSGPVANATLSVTAASGAATYVDTVTVFPFGAGVFNGRTVLALDGADVATGGSSFQLRFTARAAGRRCLQFILATLVVGLNGSVVSFNDTFGQWNSSVTQPTVATNGSVAFNFSTVGSRSGTVLSASLPSLYLVAAQYNCSVLPLSTLFNGQTDLTPFYNTSAVVLSPVTVSEQVAYVDTSALVGVSINVYNPSFMVTIAASADGAADVVVALVSSDEQLQFALGVQSLSAAQQLAQYTLTLQYSLDPTVANASYALVAAVVAAGSGPSTTWPQVLTTALWLSAPVPASVYAVQDYIQQWSLPLMVIASNDSPTFAVQLSTSQSRTLYLLLVDTASWPSSASSACAVSGGQVATSDMQLMAGVPSLTLSSGQQVLVYGWAVSVVLNATQLSFVNATMGYALAVPSSYDNLAFLAYLAATNTTAPVTPVSCRAASSTSASALSNAVDASVLPSSVPYRLLSQSAVYTPESTSINLSLRVGSAQQLSVLVQLWQVLSAQPLGQATLFISWAKQPTVYSTSMQLTTLPLIDHSDLYWLITLRNASLATVGSAVSRPVVSSGAVDALDLSQAATSVNLSAVASMQPSTAILLSFMLTASTASSRFLYARLVSVGSVGSINQTDLFASGSLLLLGTQGNRSHSVALTVLRPLPAHVTLQVWLAPVTNSSTAPSYQLALQSLQLSISGALPPPVDALDLTLGLQQRSIDCQASVTPLLVNVSSAASALLSVQLFVSYGALITSALVPLPTASYFQPVLVSLYGLVSDDVCGNTLYVQVALLPSSSNGNTSLATMTLVGPQLLASNLQSTPDASYLSSAPALLPFNTSRLTGPSVVISTRSGPLQSVAAVMSSDLSFSFGMVSSLDLVYPSSRLLLPVSCTVNFAPVGGSTVALQTLLISSFVPSRAASMATPWRWQVASTVTLVPVSGGLNSTMQDAIQLSALPSNVDPSVASAPFQVSLIASTNGPRTLQLSLFTNASSGYRLFAQGQADIAGALFLQQVGVSLTPLLNLSYGLQDLQLSAIMQPLDIAGAAYAQLSIRPTAVTTLPARSIGASDWLTLALVNNGSSLLSTRLTSVQLQLSGRLVGERDVNCSVSAIDSSEVVVYEFGSSVVSYTASTALTASSFAVQLQHLLYPGVSGVRLRCYVTNIGADEGQAVAFSNPIVVAVSNTSAAAITLAAASSLLSSSTSATPLSSSSSSSFVPSSLAYASGMFALPYLPASAVVGTGPVSVTVWIPSWWMLITSPPALSGSACAVSVYCLSQYISPFAVLLEAMELWVVRQRASATSPDAVTVTIQAVNASLLLHTPLCTSTLASGVSQLAPRLAGASLYNCPDLVVVNDDELASRVSRAELLSIDPYLSALSADTGRSIVDELSRYYPDALLINSQMYGTPLSTDTRLLYCNTTTLTNLGLASPPPADSQRWGSGTSYSRTWTWSVLGDYLQAIAAVYGNGTGAVFRGGDYEELILAQLIAQSSNAQLLSAQPDDSSYATTPGQGSGLTSSQYQAAISNTWGRWFQQQQSATAASTLMDPAFAVWLATASGSAASSISLAGSDTLTEQTRTLISTLYLSAIQNGQQGVAAAQQAATDLASARPLFVGCAVESSAWSAFLSAQSVIQPSYLPGINSYLGGSSASITAASSVQSLAFNLSYVLIDTALPFLALLTSSMHVLPPYTTAWDAPPFSADADYVLQQAVINVAKPVAYPLQPLAGLMAMVANDPLRHAMADVAIKQEMVSVALASASLSVQTAYFPLVVLTNVGDRVTQSQSPAVVIIGCLVIILASWVASIIVEQAVFSFHRHAIGAAMGWLFLTAVAAGGGGFWCSCLMQSSALIVEATPAPGVDTISVQFALDLALALIPLAILPTFLGLLLMLPTLKRARTVLREVTGTPEKVEGQANVDTSSMSRSTSTSTGSTRLGSQDPTAVAKKRKQIGSAMSWMEMAYLLRLMMCWHTVACGTLMALSLAATRVLAFNVWVVAATFTPSVVATVLCFVLDAALCTMAVNIMFHALKGRMLGVLLVPAALIVDYQVNFYCMTGEYTGVVSAPLIHSIVTSASVMSIVTGLLAALVCLLLVGLQFQRMKLSRYALSRKVSQLRQSVEQEKERGRLLEQQMRLAQLKADLLIKQLELINLCRPIAGEPTFLLAFAATTATSSMAHDLFNAGPKLLQRLSEADHTRRSIVRRMSQQEGSELAEQAEQSEQRKEGTVRSSLVSSSVSGTTAGQPVVAWSNGSTATTERPVKMTALERSVLQWLSALSGDTQQRNSTVGSTQEEGQQLILGGFHAHSPLTPPLQQLLHKQLTLASASAAPPGGASADAECPSTDAAVVSTAMVPRLEELLLHPVTVEVVKDELTGIHSVENLAFWLVVHRYQQLRDSRLRQLTCAWIHSTFIANSAPQQINIDNRQRASIESAISKGQATSSVFNSAQRETLMLIETNLKQFSRTANYRLCIWILEATALSSLQMLDAAQQDPHSSGSLERELLSEGSITSPTAADSALKQVQHSTIDEGEGELEEESAKLPEAAGEDEAVVAPAPRKGSPVVASAVLELVGRTVSSSSSKSSDSD